MVISLDHSHASRIDFLMFMSIVALVVLLSYKVMIPHFSHLVFRFCNYQNFFLQ